jgi:hypothetical protein
LFATLSGAASSDGGGALLRMVWASWLDRAWPLLADCCWALRLALAGGETGVELVPQLGVERLVGLLDLGQPDHARAPVLVTGSFAQLPQGMALAERESQVEQL